MGWCFGRNPLSVVCGIRLIGLPAPSGRASSATVCPFHMQDGRFTVSNPADSASQIHHSQFLSGRSFLFRCQTSRSVQRTAFLRVSGVSSVPYRTDSHTPTHQPNNKYTAPPIKLPCQIYIQLQITNRKRNTYRCMFVSLKNPEFT